MENTTSTRTRKTILSIVAAGITAAAITMPVLTASAAAGPEATETPSVTEAPTASIQTVPFMAAAPVDASNVDRDAADIDAPGIYGADEEVEARIVDTMARFEAAGLTLPPLRIYVHADEIGCHGHMGLFNLDGRGDRVDICRAGQWVIGHELAHAWEYHAVTEAAREDLLHATGKPVWNDSGHSHLERAVEDAANAVEFAIRPEAFDPAQATEVQLRHMENFEILTGRPSPRLP